MAGKTIGRKLLSVFFSAVLAGELAVVLDAALVWAGIALSVVKFGMLFLGLFLLLMILPGFRMERKRLAALVCTAILVIPSALGYVCW